MGLCRISLSVSHSCASSAFMWGRIWTKQLSLFTVKNTSGHCLLKFQKVTYYSLNFIVFFLHVCLWLVLWPVFWEELEKDVCLQDVIEVPEIAPSDNGLFICGRSLCFVGRWSNYFCVDGLCSQQNFCLLVEESAKWVKDDFPIFIHDLRKDCLDYTTVQYWVWGKFSKWLSLL